MNNRLCVFSFFAGAGFLDLGFESAGFSVKLVNELHGPFMEVYRYARENMGISPPEYGFYEGDIFDFLSDGKKLKKFRGDYSKEIIGFIGGPPCPDFSIGGKNRGREGENGKLSATYVELICQEKPDFFLFENVKGLWRTKKHRAFYDEIKHKVHEAGYFTTERLINCIEYGVPQDRERIILVGFKDNVIYDLGFKRLKSKYLPDGLFPWEKYIVYHKEEVFSKPWPTTDPFEENGERACPEGIIPELTVEYWFKKNDVERHPNCCDFFQPRAAKEKFAVIEEGDVSKKSYKRLHRWRYSPTAAYGNNEVHLHPYKVRRISVAEALAIQSLPKKFILPPNLSLTNMFKTIGNGVPYLASKAVAQTVKDFMEGL